MVKKIILKMNVKSTLEEESNFNPDKLIFEGRSLSKFKETFNSFSWGAVHILAGIFCNLLFDKSNDVNDERVKICSGTVSNRLFWQHISSITGRLYLVFFAPGDSLTT